MRDFAPVVESEARAQRVTSGLCAVIALAAAVALLMVSAIDAVQAEQALREQWKPTEYQVATMSLSRPAAFRMATPTLEQMASLEALLQVARGW